MSGSAGFMRAHLYASPVSAAPWLYVFTALPVALFLARSSGESILAARALVVAFAVASLVAAPVAHYLAERLGRRDAEAVLPAAAALLAGATAAGALLGGALAAAARLDLPVAATVAGLGAAFAAFFTALAALGATRTPDGSAAAAIVAAFGSVVGVVALSRSYGPIGALAGLGAGPLAGAAFAAARLFRDLPAPRPVDPWVIRAIAARPDVAATGILFATAFLAGARGLPGAAAALGYATALPGLVLVLLRLEPPLGAALRDFHGAAAHGAPLDEIRARRRRVTAALRRSLIVAALVQGVLALVAALLAPHLLAAAGLDAAAGAAPFRTACAAGIGHTALALLLSALFLLDARPAALGAAALAALAAAGWGYAAGALSAAALAAFLADSATRTLEQRAFSGEPLSAPPLEIPRFAKDRT